MLDHGSQPPRRFFLHNMKSHTERMYLVRPAAVKLAQSRRELDLCQPKSHERQGSREDRFCKDLRERILVCTQGKHEREVQSESKATVCYQKEKGRSKGDGVSFSPCCVFRIVCACSVVSDSLRLHGPTRFLWPWGFPGKNTGVASISFFRGSSLPWDRIRISCVSCLQVDSLLLSHLYSIPWDFPVAHPNHPFPVHLEPVSILCNQAISKEDTNQQLLFNEIFYRKIHYTSKKYLWLE